MGIYLDLLMSHIDFIRGGNTLVAAKSTVKIFSRGMSMFGSYDQAYRYTYLFRNGTITKYAKYPRDFHVSGLFQEGEMLNCTYITVANLLTGAAPSDFQFDEAYQDFHGEISKHLRKHGIPEQYVSGNNRECIAHIARFLCQHPLAPLETWDSLILGE